MITGVAGNTPYNDINKRKKKTDTTQFEVTPKVGQKTFGVQFIFLYLTLPSVRNAVREF